ncbi:LysR family transcriptional regulator [Alkaliphilus crotonatoxidans]
MEIRTLQTFLVVAEELNLTRAAIKLNYSQPTVTKHIKSLEDELGTVLLTKHNGKYVLTHAGERLYKHTINIIREINMTYDISPKQGAKRTIKFQGHDYYGFRYFIPVIKEMIRLDPTITFEINASSNESTIRKLLKKEIDLGIVSGIITSSDLIHDCIGYEGMCICISKKNYAANQDLKYYLEKYPVIIDQAEKFNYHNFFDKYLNQPTIIHCSSDEITQEAILQADILGIVRSGRLQQFIQSEEIVILETLTKEEPIHVVRNKSTAYDNHIINCYDLILKQAQFNKNSKVLINWG